MSGGGDAQNGTETKLKEGIHLILSRWSVLVDAVDQEMAGRGSWQLADQLASDVYTWFIQKRKAGELYIDDLEEVLEKGMETLSVYFDDDSYGDIEEVAEALMIMHEEWLAGDYSYVEKLRAAPKPQAVETRQRIVQAAGNEDDSSSSGGDDGGDGDTMIPEGSESDMAVDSAPTITTPAAPQMDDDGWTVVSSSRRNKGRRN
ncbi:hypothetical protein LINGRAHAP2_LOCUS12749 [Linum grandiflorum]